MMGPSLPEWAVDKGTSFGNRLIFPAPESSYKATSYSGNLHLIPWSESIGLPEAKSSGSGSSSSSSSTRPDGAGGNHGLVFDSVEPMSASSDSTAPSSTALNAGGGDQIFPMKNPESSTTAGEKVGASASGAPEDTPTSPSKMFSSSASASASASNLKDDIYDGYYHPSDRYPGLPVLWFPSSISAATVILYLHGNAEDLGMCQSFLKHMNEQFRVNVIGMEYPGYGRGA